MQEQITSGLKSDYEHDSVEMPESVFMTKMFKLMFDRTRKAMTYSSFESNNDIKHKLHTKTEQVMYW